MSVTREAAMVPEEEQEGSSVAELLEKHFDTAFAAPDGIKKLRELILTLAMQGKLVPQGPDDQPASELLKQIEAEMRRLHLSSSPRRRGSSGVKGLDSRLRGNDGMGSKSEEAPFELPKGWAWVRLGDVSEVNGGFAFKSSKYTNDGMRVIRISDFDEKGFKNDKVVRYQFSDDLRNFKLEPNNILMAMTGGTVGKNLLVKELPEPMVVNQRVATIRILPGVIPEYVNSLIQTNLIQSVIHNAKNSTNDNISMGDITGFLVPLAPLAEQHRIVAKIDQLMARCDELEKLRAEREQKRLTVHTAALSRLLEPSSPSPSSSFPRRRESSDSMPEKAGSPTESFGDDKQFSKASDAWRFITQHFGELYSVKENVTELRKAILQLAVMGKLVPQDPHDQPAGELLKEIAAEKKRLVKEGKIKVPKPLPEINLEEMPYALPESWKWQCLDAILVFGPTNGFSPKAVEYETPVRSLTLTATTSGRFKAEHSKFISNDIPSDSDLWLRDGDILVQRGNTLEYVGVPAVYRGEPNRFIYPDLMMKLRVSPEVDTSFVHLAMSSELCRDFLRSRASGTSGTMPKINQTTLRSLPIPLPPLAEQHRIVAKIDQLMTLCDAMEQQIDAATGKRTALLNAVMAQV